MIRSNWLAVVTALFSFAALAQDPKPAPQPDPEEQAQIQMLNQSVTLMQQGRAADLNALLDKMNAKADEKVKAAGRKVYTARTPTESLLYLTKAANDKEPTGAVVYNVVWSEGYFLKGFVLNGSGQTDAAEPWLQKALAMAPMNSQYLLELGNLYTRQKNWPAALDDFHKGEEASRAFAPDTVKNSDLGKAWRGIGYVLVEQNKLDEAEKIYQQCLDLNPGDQRAANELKYVRSLKDKAAAAKP
jgi:tetratricopeptide (TPR) repeat protein